MQRIVKFILIICLGILPMMSWAIDEVKAKQIAEQAAGCGPDKICDTRARMLEDERWTVIVWFVYGYRDNGEPIFVPGGWVGFTISKDGKIVDKTPGR